MSLQALPEDLLYTLLPEVVVTGDVRGLLWAVVGGYQDRLDDLRSYAHRMEFFLDPLETAPGGAFNSVAVTFTGPQGLRVTRSLVTSFNTPDGGEELKAWAASKLQVDISLVTSAAWVNDPLRHVDVNLLEYLALTIGAVAYKAATPLAETAAETLRRQRQAVESYFPRLKSKGAANSFSALARLLGFKDARLTPLWGRVSPRHPADVGASQNDADFSAVPDFYPSPEISVIYDPAKLNDGPYYQWSSGALEVDASSPAYYSVVNGANPFIRVTLPGGAALPTSGSVVAPEVGTYRLSGGGPHVKASVSASSSMAFQALAEGESFNGLEVVVTDTGGGGRQLSVLGRLSSVKYRTSFYTLTLLADLEQAENESIFVTRNQSLEDLLEALRLFSDVDWIFSDSSLYLASQTFAFTLAMAPFYPLSSGGPVGPSEAQLNSVKLIEAGAQASTYLDEVRAATRFPRRVTAGYVWTDAAVYAAYQSREELFVTSTAAPHAGVATGFPAPPYAVEIGLQTSREGLATRGHALEAFARVTLSHVPERGSISILSNGATIGQDDGLGHIAALDPVVLGGTVDYDTRKVMVKLDGPSLQVVVRYLFLSPLSQEANPATPQIIHASSRGLEGTYSLDSASYLLQDTGGHSVRWAATPGVTYRVQGRSTVFDPWTTQEDVVATMTQEEWSINPGSSALLFQVLKLPELSVVPSMTYDVTTPPGYAVVAGWLPESTELVRLEPGTALKQQGKVGYQARPEDQEDFIFLAGNGTTYIQLHDECPWLRPITAGGEQVDLNFYQPPVADVRLTRAADTVVIRDHRGAEYDLVAHDAMRGALSPSIRVSTILRDAAGQPGQPAVCLDGGTLCPVGLVQGVLVADPVSFFSSAHRVGLVSWLSLNEHADDDLQVVGRVGPSPIISGIEPASRRWNSTRGWHLQLEGEARIAASLGSLGPQLSASVQLMALAPDPAHYGAERVTAATYPGSGTYTILLGVGEAYILTIGESEVGPYLDGVTGITPGREFVCQSGSLVLTGTVALPVTASIRSLGPQAPEISVGPVTWRVEEEKAVAFTRGEGGELTKAATFPLALGEFRQVYARLSGGVLILGDSLTEVSLTGSYDMREISVELRGALGRPCGVHDLRSWATFKSAEDMAEVRLYARRARAVAGALPYILTAGRGERWGLQSLPSGLVTPVAAPSARAENFGYATRYAETGRYEGDLARQVVGLGGGQTLPEPWNLGCRVYEVDGRGRAVVSTSRGAPPGYNMLWDQVEA
jgi:hypothetical protein